MRYLQTYEKFKFVDYTDSDFLNFILNKVREPYYGMKCSISNYLSAANPFWFTCIFKAKNNRDATNKIYEYKIFMKEKKEQLKKLPEIENIDYQCKGRNEPINSNSKYSVRKKAGEIVFEVKVQLTEQAFNDVQLEIEYHQNSKDYNL